MTFDVNMLAEFEDWDERFIARNPDFAHWLATETYYRQVFAGALLGSKPLEPGTIVFIKERYKS